MCFLSANPSLAVCDCKSTTIFGPAKFIFVSPIILWILAADFKSEITERYASILVVENVRNFQDIADNNHQQGAHRVGQDTRRRGAGHRHPRQAPVQVRGHQIVGEKL